MSRGIDITPAEVVEALASKEAYQAYRAIGEKLATENAQLKKDIARYVGADPSKVTDGGNPTGGASTNSGGFQIDKMFG